jgi:nicotinamidase-related amidase
MTTLEGRPNTALLVIDAQNAILAAAAGRDGVLANIGGLIGRARAEGVPVIWIQHSGDGLPPGSEGWRSREELPRPHRGSRHRGGGQLHAARGIHPLTRRGEQGEMPLSGIRWRRER